MVNKVWVNADHGRDLHLFADHITKLQNFTKEENYFSAFRLSLQLILEQAFTNLLGCLVISKNYIQKLHK